MSHNSGARALPRSSCDRLPGMLVSHVVILVSTIISINNSVRATWRRSVYRWVVERHSLTVAADQVASTGRVDREGGASQVPVALWELRPV
jgi:CO/xanthine dehydrogenase FAD-binding subunit